VPIDPVGTVTDASGNGVPGVAVTFTVTSGGGHAANASATTDLQGNASSGAWTLGSMAGSNTLSAVASGLQGSPAVFTATGSSIIGPPSVLVKVSGDGQTGVAGTALAESLVVRLEDANGHGVPGVPVTWAALSGGGTFGPAAAVTDGNGRLASSWTLGGTVGGNSARATSAGFQANFAQPASRARRPS
jgi:adhesin/invasin